MSDGYANLWFDVERIDDVLYGSLSTSIRYGYESEVIPGDIVDLVDEDGDRFGIGNIDFVAETPIHRLPMTPIPGVPEFDGIDEALEYVKADNADANVQESDTVAIVGLFNIRPV